MTTAVPGTVGVPAAGRRALALVAGAEGRAAHPRVERVLVTPAGHDQPGGAVVHGLQELEALEAVLVVEYPRSGREALGQLVPAVGCDGDGVDLDDGHGAMVAGSGPSAAGDGRALPAGRAEALRGG